MSRLIIWYIHSVKRREGFWKMQAQKQQGISNIFCYNGNRINIEYMLNIRTKNNCYYKTMNRFVRCKKAFAWQRQVCNSGHTMCRNQVLIWYCAFTEESINLLAKSCAWHPCSTKLHTLKLSFKVIVDTTFVIWMKKLIL